MWLDRFERVDGKLAVVGVDQCGQSTFIPPEQMYKSKPRNLRNSDAITLRTSFCDWTQTSTCEYAAAFGTISGVTELHETYVVPTQSTRVVLPALQLQRALLGAPSVVAQYVYAPNGLEHLCSPILDNKDFSIGFLSKKQLGRTRTRNSFIQRIEWFYAFPSAYRAWSSFYRLACCGKIGVELPAAEVLMSAHGKYVGDTLYVHGLDILELTPLEPPLEWAEINRERYVVAGGLAEHIAARKTQDTRLRPRSDKWDMTDDEWIAIEPIASHRSHPDRPGRPSRHLLRDVVDGVIIKLGTGISWSELWNQRAAYGASPTFHKRMKVDGRWDKIVEILVRTRQQAS
ncbi:transposase [Paraburkholderia sp. D1E]|uniref:transposase n=1 Tax=Paraburkholderia sp. D1E TaxID=3461398 RepID=UPI004045D886